MVASPRRRLLLVEHDDLLRRTTADFLAAAGFDVRDAAGADDACRLALTAPPDLALIHVGLGGRGGWSVVRVMREADATRGCPIVATSGRPIGAYAREPMLAEVEAYLMKPWEPEFLVAVLVGAMGGGGIADRRLRDWPPPAP